MIPLPASSENSTAILFFANSAKVDQHRKQLAKSELLFNAMTRDMLSKLNRTGIPFFHFNEQQQVGEDFGSRFIAAMTWVFQQGFENIITVGNDTPQLTTRHLLEARKQLEQGKIVVGPSLDGGFYLLGLSKDQFDPTIFAQLPWQHASLFQKITSLLKQTRVLHILPSFSDIDTTKAIHILLPHKKLISSTLYGILKQFVHRTFVSTRSVQTATACGFIPIHRNKGSPGLLPQI